MTTYTIKTNKHEANHIARGNKMYVFRKDNIDYKIGTVLDFIVYDEKKPIRHAIDEQKYMVSAIERGDPIMEDVVLLGIKRII